MTTIATTQTTIQLTETGAVVNVRVELCGAPRKVLPRIVETTGHTVSEDATVIRPAQFARAS